MYDFDWNVKIISGQLGADTLTSVLQLPQLTVSWKIFAAARQVETKYSVGILSLGLTWVGERTREQCMLSLLCTSMTLTPASLSENKNKNDNSEYIQKYLNVISVPVYIYGNECLLVDGWGRWTVKSV